MESRLATICQVRSRWLSLTVSMSNSLTALTSLYPGDLLPDRLIILNLVVRAWRALSDYNGVRTWKFVQYVAPNLTWLYSSNMENRRFHFIDTLRGVAALLVVLFHAKAGGHIDNFISSVPAWIDQIFSHGDLGVAIFFVLSGFVIAHSLRNEAAGLKSSGRFMLRRSIRLDPPYWAAIIVVISFAALARVVMPEQGRESVTAEQLLAHIFYLQDLLGFSQIDPVFWTLCLEVQFYLAYSIALIAGGYRPETGIETRRMRLVLALTFLISLVWVFGIMPQLWPGLFLPFFHCFLLGVGVYWAWLKPPARLWFFVFWALVSIGGLWRSDLVSLASAGTAAVIAIAALSGNISATSKVRSLQFLGLVSYSLYLFHNPITGASFNVGYRISGRTPAMEACWLGVSILACIFTATLMWWAVERPSMALARRISSRLKLQENRVDVAPTP